MFEKQRAEKRRQARLQREQKAEQRYNHKCRENRFEQNMLQESQR